MNRKQNVLEICCYIAALILLLLYCKFGKSLNKTMRIITHAIETPQITDRVQ